MGLYPDLTRLLAAADRAMDDTVDVAPLGPLRVGVDLGTAFTVLFVVDESGFPIAGAYRFADVVRDGVVLDYLGAVDLVKELKADVEARIGQPLTTAAVTIPPGVPISEVRSHGYVVSAAGLECTCIVDEPTAANAILGVTDGAVVDIGGEPTGGTHLSLVIAGAHGIDFGRAELMKRDPANHARLFPVVRPVLEKIGTIVRDQVAGHRVTQLHLVGGTSAFTGIEGVIASVTGIPTDIPGNPLFVTPLGVALYDDPNCDQSWRG